MLLSHPRSTTETIVCIVAGTNGSCMSQNHRQEGLCQDCYSFYGILLFTLINFAWYGVQYLLARSFDCVIK